jgi:hypothetical protein
VKLVDRLADPRQQASPKELERSPWRYLVALEEGAHAEILHIGRRQLAADPRAVSPLLAPGESQTIHGGDSDVVLPNLEGWTVPPEPEFMRLYATGGELQCGPLFPLHCAKPLIDGTLELAELVEKSSEALASICRRPYLDLTVEESAEPLRRVRQMTIHTAPYLAMHAEDWEGPGVQAPFPRRLLTSQPDENWNTYENRLVRTTVSDAVRELRERFNTVEAELRQLRERDSLKHLSETRGGDWARRYRICELLGESGLGGLDFERKNLENESRELRTAASKLGAARGSPLFVRLRDVKDEREPRPTNLLQHESRYHIALKVRLALNDLHRRRELTAVRDVLGDYYRWVFRALGTALGQLGFSPLTTAKGLTTTPLRWKGRLGTILVTAHEHRRVLLLEPPPSVVEVNVNRRRQKRRPREREAARTSLLILPLWAVPDDRTAILRAIARAAQKGGHRVLVVTPGEATLGGEEFENEVDPLRPHGWHAIGPSRLDSVEILAREVLRETWLASLTTSSDASSQDCPACPSRHLETAEHRCPECHTHWGVRVCDACNKRRQPYLFWRGNADEDRKARTDGCSQIHLFPPADEDGKIVCAICGGRL